MYHQIKFGKISSSFPRFRIFWYGLTFVAWFFLYYIIIQIESNLPLLILVLLIGFGTLSLIHALIINKILSIFKYWLLMAFGGMILGLLWMGVFLASLVVMIVILGAFALSIFVENQWIQTIVFLTLVPIGYSLVFFLLTTLLWIKGIKPLYNSEKLNEHQRIVVEGLILYGGSLYLSISVSFAILILFISNFGFAYLLSAFTFSFITESGSNDIYEETKLFQIFTKESSPE